MNEAEQLNASACIARLEALITAYGNLQMWLVLGDASDDYPPLCTAKEWLAELRNVSPTETRLLQNDVTGEGIEVESINYIEAGFE